MVDLENRSREEKRVCRSLDCVRFWFAIQINIARFVVQPDITVVIVNESD